MACSTVVLGPRQSSRTAAAACWDNKALCKAAFLHLPEGLDADHLALVDEELVRCFDVAKMGEGEGSGSYGSVNMLCRSL